jgi:hypothetical protein
MSSRQELLHFMESCRCPESDEYELDGVYIPEDFFVPDLADKIMTRIESGRLDMDLWVGLGPLDKKEQREFEEIFGWPHTQAGIEDTLKYMEHNECGTVACLAGWAYHFAKPSVQDLRGRRSSVRVGFEILGQFLFQKSLGEVPDFMSTEEEAEDFIRRHLKNERN